MAIKLNYMTGIVTMEPPKLFDPTGRYFASMPNSKEWELAYGSLVESVLDKLPFIPKVRALHPALKMNYHIIRELRGEAFAYNLKLVEEAFNRLIKSSSRKRDIEFRIIARRLRHLIETELHDQRMLEAHERFYYKLFDDRAIRRAQKSDEKLRAWVEKVFKASERLKEIYEKIDRKRIEAKDKFWEIYDKNREILPRPVSISGVSLQAVLNEIPWMESSELVRSLKIIQHNRLHLYAEQIAESYDGRLPSELISKNILFRRKVWEQFQRELVKDKIFQDHLDHKYDYMDERTKKVQKYYSNSVENAIKASDKFNDYWNEIYEDLPIRISYSSTNYAEALQNYNRANSPKSHITQHNAKESFMKSRADALIGSMSHSIPSEVYFNYGIDHPYRPHKVVNKEEQRTEIREKSSEKIEIRKAEIKSDDKKEFRIKTADKARKRQTEAAIDAYANGIRLRTDDLTPFETSIDYFALRRNEARDTDFQTRNAEALTQENLSKNSMYSINVNGPDRYYRNKIFH